VDFTLPQQRLADVAVGMTARITLGGDAGRSIEAKIAAVDPTIDPATRSIKVRADVEHETAALRPGMFVAVEVVLPRRETFVVVPATAVVRAPYGDSVFIVEEKKREGAPEPSIPMKTARQQFVRLGPARGDFVAVLEGVTPKQEVVMAGAFKLRNDSPIAVDNSKAPRPQLEPRPENR
jgi:membrane fusion protein (multidrug efflux system)